MPSATPCGPARAEQAVAVLRVQVLADTLRRVGQGLVALDAEVRPSGLYVPQLLHVSLLSAAFRLPG